MNEKQTLFYYLAQITGKESVVEVLRVGVIHDRGLSITGAMLSAMVKNFHDNVYGTEIQVNLEHKRGSEAAGWVRDLYIEENRLMARIEWTEMGEEKIIKKLFRYVSAEFASKFPHFQNGDLISNVFIGLALTNTPALKAQEALMLSEEIGLIYKDKRMFKTFLEEMKARKFVSAEDKELVRKMLAELSEEEQEAEAEAVAEVEAKPEAPEAEAESEEAPAEEKEEEAKEEEATEDEAKEEAPAEEGKEEALAESTLMAEKDARIAELEEKLLTDEVGKVADKFMLSEDTNVGFPEASRAKLVGLMLKLSAEDRGELEKLLGDVTALEMGAIGSTNVVKKKVVTDENLEEAIVDRTEELLSEAKEKGTELTVEQAQKLAKAEFTK